MSDIGHFLKQFGQEYQNVTQELDTGLANGKTIDPAVLIGVDCGNIGEKTRAIWRQLKMSEEDIVNYESELREVEMDMPPKPGCLSPNSILDYVECHSSPQDNKKYFSHLLECRDCRDKVFKVAWFFLD